MAQLAIKLLGSFQVTLDGRPITNFATDKARALLAFLAVERDRPHRREALATLLWPDQPEERARQSLRQALLHLRQALCDNVAACPFVLLDRNELQLNPAADVHLDVSDFVALAEACDGHRHRSASSCLPCLRRAEAMLAGYAGDFLAGCSIPDSAVFEEWAVMKREWLHVRAVEALTQLADYHERRGEIRAARAYVQRQVQLEPWREEAHRQLMTLLALDGQRSAALAQYETCRRILQVEFGAAPAAETVQLRAQLQDGVGVGLAALSPHSTPPVSGPAATPFFGRETELADLAELLAGPGCRLVTLTGPGGVGKSRLAGQVAESHRGLFADGVIWVDLAPVARGEGIAAAIGDALALPPVPERDAHWLFRYLRDRELLIVLDNFEHLVDDGVLLGELLRHAPRVMLLVVSRERLRLSEEWVYPLEGLTYPRALEKMDAEPLHYSALALFRQRAMQVQRRFSLTRDRLPAVIAICSLVEGFPLGIELAAAALAERSCEEVAVALGETLDALDTTLRNLPPRHRSLRATFEHAWSSLGAREQQRFTALAVFAVSFDGGAAQRVADATEMDLARLTAKSLLISQEGRYRWHQSVYQFAAERMAADPCLADELRDRHAMCFAARTAASAARLNGADAREALVAMERDQANLGAAWRWAVARRQIAWVSELLTGIGGYYRLQGPAQEGLALIDYALSVFDGAEAAPLMLLAQLRAAQVQMLNLQSRYDEALGGADHVVALATQAASADLLAMGHFLRGRTLQQQGKYDEAEEALAAALRSLDALESDADPEVVRLMADLLRELGNIATRRGEQAAAQAHYEAALGRYRVLKDLRGESAVLNNLGALAWDWGDYGEAQDRLTAALALYRMLGNLTGEAKALNNLANLAADHQDYDAAFQAYQRVIELHRSTHNDQAQSAVLNNLGALLWELGRYDEAQGAYRQALAIHRTSGNRQAEGETLANLSLVGLRLGNLQAALAWGRQAVAAATASADPINLANAFTYLGKIHVEAHQWDEAEDAYRKALTLRQEVPHPARLLELTAGLAYLALRRGRPAEALMALAPVLDALAPADGVALIGAEEPGEIRWICYEILRANGDPRTASCLAEAQQWLMDQAARISDPALRQSYLENVPAHRQIAEAR